jgi:glucosamine--fructose-6-phosphate aminotransferase (isomerizing)
MERLGNFPDPFLAEITAQPDALRSAVAALRDQRPVLDRLREAGVAARTVVFTGMGASYDACYPAVNDLAERGIPALHVDTAELLHFRRGILGPRTLLVIVSQSGESAEIVRLTAELAKQDSRPVIVSVTNGLSNDLATGADMALDTRAGPEIGPSTKTFVASLATLSAVASLLAGDDVGGTIDQRRVAAEGAARAAERLLAGAEAFAEDLERWLSPRDITVVLGRGPARAAAEMGALTLKECGIMAESLESAAFRHGPLELAGPDMAALLLATEPETRHLDLGLAHDLVEAGAAVLVVTPDGEAPEGAHAVATGDQDRALLPAVSIIPIQLFAWRLTVRSGRTPGTYVRASKVTTRE